MKKKVKQINCYTDVSKKCAKIYPKCTLYWNLNSKLRKYFAIKP